ncbi:MAG: hypothetical protein LBH44_12885 [Treponema sp.]|jgi:diacylglycerol kinase family enzyme|nr:hypothetical protein [Treponema sp.]
MKHVFVFDPKSFTNQQWRMENILDHIGQFFRTQDRPDFSIQLSRYRRNAIGIIQSEVEKAKEGDIVRIYAIGGEEILFDCLNGIANLPNMELAFMPYGETNNFLNCFGTGKTELFRDIPAMVQAEAVPTDMINWDINYALNSCFIGFNSATAIKLKELESKMSKRSFMFFSKITSFFNYVLTAFDKEIAAQHYTITVDDRDFSGSYSLIHVANGPFHGGKIAGVKAAMPNDGLLDIALIKSADPLKTMWSMGRYSRGKVPSICTVLQGKNIKITSDREMWMQLDNEYVQDTNISLSVVPQAVQMVAAGKLSYQKQTSALLRKS